MIARIALVAGLLFSGLVLVAQGHLLQTPDEFLPHPLGTRFTAHHLLVEYYRYIAKESPNVRLVQYGESYEGRPLVAAIVSDEANLARLEELRLNNLRRTGLEPGAVVPDDIAFVQLSYSVHGNEAAGSEAAMAVLYDLVTLPEAREWLRKTVVILDPSQNPDGYTRFSQWSNSVSSRRPNPSPVSREHDEPWPGGRSNHYQFDLNRDWAWLTQQESRARIAFYLQWMPQVHADVHEFTGQAPYYFPPAARPYHSVLTPWQAEFQDRLGRNHARHFDANGWGYFTRERYDLFYPSYGDTYPAFSGAIGMTYEQGGGGFANLAVLRENGDTLTLADRIAHHRVASLSTVEISAANAAALVRGFEDFYQRPASRRAEGYTQYVLSANHAQGKLADLLRLLDKHKIRYGQAAAHRKNVRGFDYGSGMTGNREIQAGDLVIPADQPRGALVQVLFDPQSRLEDSLTYDITAWSLPMAYGLPAMAISEPVPMKPWEPVVSPGPDRSGPWPYAFLVEWGSMASVRLIARLQQMGVVARYAEEAFRVEGRDYPAGTIIVLRSDNRLFSGLPAAMAEAVSATGVVVHPVRTGYVEKGKDFGSYSYPLLRVPRVLSLAGPGVSSLNMGEIWYYFEEELDYPIDLVRIESLDGIRLVDYNVIVLPEGYYPLSRDFQGHLQAWIADGGTLIALGSANQKLAGQPGFDLKLASDTRTDSLKRESMAHEPDLYASEDRNEISDDIPGAIFRTAADAGHPLTFGLGQPYFSLKTNPAAYAMMSRGNALWIGDDVIHYGFAGYRALARLPDSLVAGRQSKGNGSVTYLIDNPLFRAFWYDGKLLMANALFF